MNLLPSLAEMLKNGVHFGHQKSRWHPKMKQYIFGTRNGVHIIDLEKTLEEMDKTLSFVKNLAAQGKVILFVGTKRQARDLIKAAAESCEMPYVVERWIGGLLTNAEEMKRRLRKYLNMKEQFATGEVEKYTKKEQVKFKKDLDKMDKYLIGLAKMDKVPDALYIADLRTEKTAIAEAVRTEIPVVAICDTNVDPTEAGYIIPANDDAVNSIKLMADAIANAVNEGRKEYAKNKAAAVANEEKVRAEAIKPRRVIRKEESL